MAADENSFKGSKIGRLDSKEKLINAMLAIIPSNLTNDNVVFLCIGTDRSTGDSLGPFIGAYLTGLGYQNVIGTIDDPTHAQNLKERLDNLPEGKRVIAIDACLGQFSNVGTYSVINGSIKPGAGVKKDLPEAGDYGIIGVVNIGGFMEYHVLQNTRLSTVMKMAKDITSAIVEVFPLEVDKENKVLENVVVEKDVAFAEIAAGI